MELRLNRTRGGLDKLQIRHAPFAERCGDADYRCIAFCQQVEVRAGPKITYPYQAFDASSVDMGDVASPQSEFLDFAVVNIEAIHLKPCFGETARQRQGGAAPAAYLSTSSPRVL